ncbi:MAG TPA: hypothetical protein VK644_12705 [Chitinophagaceae bacterium]|nr:hypothetical protein [Chitinophagaceae bacterium]
MSTFTANTTRPSVPASSVASLIVRTGLLAGTLDALAASIQFYLTTDKNPAIVFRYIASAVFGKDALAGGTSMAVWGLLLHYLIAFIFTILFVLAFPRLRLGRFNKYATGIIYALLVWCIMNLVVVPMAFSRPFQFHLKGVLISAGILVVCIGLPISLMTNWFYGKKVNRES